ncbi:MAG: hypothetical protein Q9227_001264 [Pyrenula ochraceoflavens]
MQSLRNGSKAAVKSWSSSIFLPRSDFPVRPAPELRPQLLNECTDKLYHRQLRKPADTGSFTLHDGPPYANGKLHIGHALNKILKDIICRTEIGFGKRVRYVPGWDCHGLPIELKALEANENGTQGTEVSKDPVAVRAAARNLAKDTVEMQKAEFKSWAVLGDWKHAWTTMDHGFELAQLDVFKQMVQKDLITRKNRPVYWSPSSKTALAEAELEYDENHVSYSAIVKFPLSSSILSSLGGEQRYEDINVPIWTTTPWTLPANQAIAFNRNLDYMLVNSPTHGRLLVATSRFEYLQRALKEDLEILHNEFSGTLLDEEPAPSYLLPFSPDRASGQLLHADFVTSESGTGFVHCAPGHGLEDYEALLPMITSGQVSVQSPVDDDGCFIGESLPQELSHLAGKKVLGEGSKLVVDTLRNQGALLGTERYRHKYPYDWRTKQPVIVRATPQWFANVSSVKDFAKRALEHVTFQPESGRDRLLSFLQNRSEWCISRQRAWGLPIPAIFNAETGEAILTPKSIEHIMARFQERGTDAWWTDPPHDPAWIAPSCLEQDPKAVFGRGTDTMDVWFDSGTSWTRLRKMPADLYIEGTDQHRGWFQSSLLTKIASRMPEKGRAQARGPAAPYRSLITHGFTLDQHGKKMSKSLGNVISPEQIIKGEFNLAKVNNRKASSSGLGPDVLRLWVASCDFTKDVTVSPEVLSNVQEHLHKYRVTLKLLLGALADFHPEGGRFPYIELRIIDQIALWQLSKVTKKVFEALRNYQFYRAVRELNQWINGELSAFYIEAIKDRLYCSRLTSPERRSVQIVLYNIFHQMLSMLSPLTPLLVQESEHYTPESVRKDWIYLRSFKATRSREDAGEFEGAWPILQNINGAVKEMQEVARKEKKLGSSIGSYVQIQVPVAAESASILRKYESALQDMTVVSRLVVDEGKTVDAAAWWYEKEVPLANEEIIKVIVHAPPEHMNKCARCWQFTVDCSTASSEKSEDLCDRCSEVVEGMTLEGAGTEVDGDAAVGP